MTWVDATIAEVVQETPLDRSFILRVPEAARTAFDFAPGQYVVVRDPADAEERDWYFSLSAAPNDEGTLRVTVRGRGKPVQRIYGAEAGTTWRVAPPAGAFRFEADAGERVVLAGAGSGVTPFRALIEAQGDAGTPADLWLLQSARRPEELIFHAEFEAWAADRDTFTYVPMVTSKKADWRGRCGRIDQALLLEALGDVDHVRLFACGPAAFVDHVLALGVTLGVPPDRCCRQ